MLLEIIGLPAELLGPVTIHGTLKGGDGGVDAIRSAFRAVLRKRLDAKGGPVLVIFHGAATRTGTVPGIVLRATFYGEAPHNNHKHVCDALAAQAFESFGRLFRPDN